MINGRQQTIQSMLLVFSHILGPHCQCAENRIAYSPGVLKATWRCEGCFCVVLLSVFSECEQGSPLVPKWQVHVLESDWSLQNQHFRYISNIHCFISLTVTGY